MATHIRDILTNLRPVARAKHDASDDMTATCDECGCYCKPMFRRDGVSIQWCPYCVWVAKGKRWVAELGDGPGRERVKAELAKRGLSFRDMDEQRKWPQEDK